MSDRLNREEPLKRAKSGVGGAVADRELRQSWIQNIQLLFNRMKTLQEGSGDRNLMQSITSNIEQAMVLADALNYSDNHNKLLGVLDDWRALLSDTRTLKREVLEALIERVGQLPCDEKEEIKLAPEVSIKVAPTEQEIQPTGEVTGEVPAPSVWGDIAKETKSEEAKSVSRVANQDDLLDKAEPLDFPEEGISSEGGILDSDKEAADIIGEGQSEPIVSAELGLGKSIPALSALGPQKLAEIERALANLSEDSHKLKQWLLLLPELGTRLGREKEHARGLSEMILNILSGMDNLVESGSSVLTQQDLAAKKEHSELLAKLALEVSATVGELEKLDDLAWGLLGSIEDDVKRISESVSLLKKLIFSDRGRSSG